MTRKFVTSLLMTSLIFASAEGTLRIQQAIGPFYNLELENLFAESLVDTVNHRPSMVERVPPTNQEFYGEFYGKDSKVAHYDVYGIRQYTWQAEECTGKRCTKILFLGDSFMQGFGEEENVPYHASRVLKTAFPQHEFTMLNAGFSSYSPAIFIVQSRKIVPVLKPDLVVVDVDETDLYDDFVRYQSLIRRDEQGAIEAVIRSPIAVHFRSGLVEAGRHALYIHRFLAKLFHTRISHPLFTHGFRSASPNLTGVLDASMDTTNDFRAKYRWEINLLRAHLKELMDSLAS